MASIQLNSQSSRRALLKSQPSTVSTDPSQSIDLGTTGADTTIDGLDEGPLLVDWDGPDDAKNPKNWPTSEFLIHTIIVSLLCLARCVSFDQP